MRILIFVSLLSADVSSRVVLTLWGAVTLVCGAFIFGQSTTITIMQILGKIWRFPSGAAAVSCVWPQSQIHGSKHEITVKQVLFNVSSRGWKWCGRSKTCCWSERHCFQFTEILGNLTQFSFRSLFYALFYQLPLKPATLQKHNWINEFSMIKSKEWFLTAVVFILGGNCWHSRLLDCASRRNSSTLTAATFFLCKALWTIRSKCFRTTTTSWWQFGKGKFHSGVVKKQKQPVSVFQLLLVWFVCVFLDIEWTNIELH